MKPTKLIWKRLVILWSAWIFFATGIFVQGQTNLSNPSSSILGTAALKVSAPNATEAADCAALVDAVNAGDAQTALQILRNNGVAEDSLSAMSLHMGEPAARVLLPEPFLKASVGVWTLNDRILKTNVQTRFASIFSNLGYERPVWMPRRPNTWTIASFDENLRQCPVSPILVLNERLADPCFIRYFRLYDRYAESVHSVVLNGPNFTNAKLDPTNYTVADRQLNAMFQLIKARKPDAFVWLGVVKEDSHSDEKWLKAMSFTPDGLQISNLRQFHSPFIETRSRYVAIVGTNMPMMVSGFYGHSAALREEKQQLVEALTNDNSQAVANVKTRLGQIGAAVGQNLFDQFGPYLESLGYRGLSMEWSLLAALANSQNAVAADNSDLIDPSAAYLDYYFAQRDYAHLHSFATDMVAKSKPGDMDWTLGRLYEGISLLKQTPPKTSEAIAALDEILAFDVKNQTGRDHYVLGAVKWRIYAALSTGDMGKVRQLVRWVQGENFRADLKANFMKKYQRLLNATNEGQK